MTQREEGDVANRFEREGDWEARQLFSEADLRLSPEEYAARRLHLWGCFALHLLRYQDQALGAWVRRVGELFDNPDDLERCRQRFLTLEELAEVRRQEAEGF